MRKLLLVIAWVPAASLSLLFSLIILKDYTHVKAGSNLLTYQAKEMLPKNGYQFYAALPAVLGSFTTAIETGDARPVILKQFLNKHGSPLAGYADFIVSISDRKEIDFRLIIAIAMCESNLGKKIPEGSYNAWGYAVYTGQNKGGEFTNWFEAIETMAAYLSEKYYKQGLTTPELIGPIYAPPSVETENSWAKCVRKFADQLQ